MAKRTAALSLKPRLAGLGLIGCVASALTAVTMTITPIGAQTLSAPPGGAVDGAQLGVALLTIGPGRPAFSWMGHAALVITDTRTGRAREFEYGVFPNGAATVRGLIFGTPVAYAAERDLQVKLQEAMAAGRAVRMQQLLLAPAARVELLQRLVDDQRPERRAYRYEDRTNNCSTRIRDLIDAATGGVLRRTGVAPMRATMRGLGFRVGAASIPAAILLDIAMNDEIDQPITRWDAAAFPEELAELVAATTVVDSRGSTHLLASESYRVPARLPSPPPPLPTRQYLFLLVGVSVGGALLLVGSATRAGGGAPRAVLGIMTALVGAALGLFGIMLGAGWAFTDYTFARHNENLLLLNPLWLAAIPLGAQYATGSAAAGLRLRRLAVVCTVVAVAELALKLTSPFDQDNWRTLMLVLPIVAGVTGALLLARAPSSPAVSPARDILGVLDHG